MQRIVDSILGVAKESLKAFSQEAFSNTIKLINGISALILTFFPGKATILEGVQGWEMRPSLRGPRLPQWMEEGVSSFNKFIHDYAASSDAETESEYESGIEDSDSFTPSSPSSHSSLLSRASSFQYNRGNGSSFKGGTFSSALPGFLRQFFGIASTQQPHEAGPDTPASPPRRSGSSGSLYRMYGFANKGFTSVRDFVIQHKTDRRRGVVEDLQLVVELSIERVFDVIRKLLLYFLSPLQTLKLFTRTLFSPKEKTKESAKVPTATLGDANPAPSMKKEKHHPAMNTDARSCADFIEDIGYPYEAIRVVTEDGYVILLERISRPESQKVLYLQHGLLDSSLGWVSSGVVGSQAFAAHDQGYDVFLGNFRGLASQDHEDRNISSQRYWNYSINEHGTKDIQAMIEKIHEIKMKELNDLHLIPSVIGGSVAQQPYSMCGLAHSLGGAGLLMHVVTKRIENKPHRFSRLILLSPAGFHKVAPLFFELYQVLVLTLAPIAAIVMPGLYIKTWIFRGLFNKLARDFQNYPAVGGLVQMLCSFFVAGGDSSNWVEALGMTHYNADDMPGVAYRVILHLAQMRRADRFQMFDYGSRNANMRIYGTPEPLDIGKHYGLIDIPVDFVAGCKDKLIPRSNVRRHYQLLRTNGCTASYAEFEYAHLDFTMAHKEDIVAYVMSKLLLATSPSTQSTNIDNSTKASGSKEEGQKVSRRLKSNRKNKRSESADCISMTAATNTSIECGDIVAVDDYDTKL